MRNSALKKLGTLAVSLSLLTALVSCGQVREKLVQDVRMDTRMEGENLILDTGASFWLGNLTFPTFTIPIRNFLQKDSDLYGEVTFSPTFDRSNEVSFWLNLSSAKAVDASEAILPNGEAIPVEGLVEATVYQLAIEKLRSRIYLGLGDSTVMTGFALGLRIMKVFRRWMDSSSMFYNFNLKFIKGSVGIYTGDDSDSNGLAFFVDLSPILSPEVINRLFSGGLLDSGILSKAKSTKNPTKLKFNKSYTGEKENLSKVQKELYRVAKKKQEVEFVPAAE